MGRVGQRNEKYHGYENEYIRVVDYAGYVASDRQHKWVIQCKICEKKRTISANKVKLRKCCISQAPTTKGWDHKLANKYMRIAI